MTARIFIDAHDVSFIYPGSTTPVFSKVSFSVYEGDRTALLGINGCGKSTLLRLLAGDLEPENGTLTKTTKDILLLKQEDYATGETSAAVWLMSAFPETGRQYARLEELEKQSGQKSDEYCSLSLRFTETGGWERYSAALSGAADLGWQEDDLERPVSTFSGGERKVLALMAGFLRQPDVYLLDEPTNYLDETALDWLADKIRSFRGACVVVSHDRDFLDKAVTKVLELERAAMKEYPGNYTSYHAQKTGAIASALHHNEKLEKEIKKLKVVERTYKNWGAQKEKAKKGAFDKGFVGAVAARLQKRAMCAKERAHKKIEELERNKIYLEKPRSIVPTGKQAGNTFLEATELSKSIGGRVLFEKLSFYLKGGDRLSIEGPNGCGKSTLMNLLAGQAAQDAGKINRNAAAKVLYLPQFWQAPDNFTTGAGYFNASRIEEACTMLDYLGCDGGILFRPLEELSEGQKRKINLARLLVTCPDIALLDEPTTHLDIRSVQLLEEGLTRLPGVVVLVSHDRRFRNNIATKSLTLEDVTKRA